MFSYGVAFTIQVTFCRPKCLTFVSTLKLSALIYLPNTISQKKLSKISIYKFNWLKSQTFKKTDLCIKMKIGPQLGKWKENLFLATVAYVYPSIIDSKIQAWGFERNQKTYSGTKTQFQDWFVLQKKLKFSLRLNINFGLFTLTLIDLLKVRWFLLRVYLFKYLVTHICFFLIFARVQKFVVQWN